MGRQVTVEVLPLLRAGCTLRIKPSSVEGCSPYLEVTFPHGRVVGSDLEDVFTFDCRNKDTSANGWIEYWLINNDVPYVSG